jgi:hypothetical protein
MKRKLGFALLLCLTLGLAPFYPEPHVVGKWRWVLGGAHGMGLLDWWDWIMHSAPFVYLTVLLIVWGRSLKKQKMSADPANENLG